MKVNMNDLQKRAILSCAAIIFAMLLYPPYRIHGHGANSAAVVETGFAWIFDLPHRATIDGITLLIEWIGVLLVGSLAIVFLADKSPK